MNRADLKRIVSCALFRNISLEEIERLLSESDVSVLTFDAGSYLMRRASTHHRLGILLKGQAVVERKTDGGLMHMSRLRESDLFGAASVFCEDETYVVDIRCVTPCRVVFWNEAAILRWCQQNESVLKNYLRYLTTRIRFLNRRLDALSKNSVPGKLMSYFSSESQEGVLTVKSYTELADTLCLSRATLYRALDTLCAEGRILRDGKKIILLEESI